MSNPDQEKQVPQQMTLQLDWHIPEHVKSQYADNVIAQARKHDMIISFFESQLPPLAGTPEEIRTTLEKVGAIRAECVGRIVVAADLIPEIIKALQTTYDGYLASKEMETNASTVQN